MAGGLWGLFAVSPSVSYYRSWEPAAGFLVVIVALTTWPKSIEVTSQLVRKRNWRMAWRWIAWDDLIATEQRFDGAVILRGVTDAIVFGPLHVGRKRFQQIVADQLR